MMPLRSLALATLLLVACSRDKARNAADSLPSMDTSRQAIDTTPTRTPTDTPPVTDSALANSRITVERAVVNGILWGAPAEEARRLLGTPQSTQTVWEEALGDSSTVLEYPGITVRIVERRVIGLHCTGQSCITGDAVRVGATRAEVVQVYGKGQRQDPGQLAYPFTTDDSCALRFELAQDKVRAIDVSCQMN